MPELIYHTQGIWDDSNYIKPSHPFYAANKGTIRAISSVALLALSSLVAGGILFGLNVNTTIAWSLLGTGAGILFLNAAIGGVLLYVRYRKKVTIVSWNVGCFEDYCNMCALKNKIKEGNSLGAAYTQIINSQFSAYPSKEETNARTPLFQQAFKQFGNPDIICLQESWQLTPNKLAEILPKGYTFFAPTDSDGIIVWNASKFTKLNHAHINYDPKYIGERNTAPDTIVKLKDDTNGMTVCITSAHLRGFSLAYDALEKDKKDAELELAKRGDYQVDYDLKTMDDVEADLYILAGDFNVTEEHYSARLDVVRNYRFENDPKDTEPTIYDANLKEADGVTPKPAKIDHIFAKGKNVQIKAIKLQTTPLTDFQRPSDHLPVGAEILVS